MAYILGFISADGSINKQKNSLSIELQSRDVEILEFIKQKDGTYIYGSLKVLLSNENNKLIGKLNLFQ